MFEYLSCAFKRIELPQKWRSCSSRAGMTVMNFAVNSKKEEAYQIWSGAETSGAAAGNWASFG
jgi:hypothetical protein